METEVSAAKAERAQRTVVESELAAMRAALTTESCIQQARLDEATGRIDLARSKATEALRVEAAEREGFEKAKREFDKMYASEVRSARSHRAEATTEAETARTLRNQVRMMDITIQTARGESTMEEDLGEDEKQRLRWECEHLQNVIDSEKEKAEEV